MRSERVQQGVSLLSLCLPLSGRMEEMGAPAGIQVLFVHEGAQRGFGQGGGTDLGRFAQMFLRPPKPSLLVG